MKDTIIQFLFIALFLLQLMSCQQSPSPSKPNILFAISDDQSYPHTSFAGCQFVQTPAFDRVARNGIYFRTCYAGSPGCAPSRSSIVTGRYHWQNEQAGQHAAGWLAAYGSFIDLLDQNGYITGRTGKGVGPFKYADSPGDSILRYGNTAGQTHSNIGYDSIHDPRDGSGIVNINYLANIKFFLDSIRGNKPFFFLVRSGGTPPCLRARLLEKSE